MNITAPPPQHPILTPVTASLRPGPAINPYAASNLASRLPPGSGNSTNKINDVDIFDPSTDISIIASSTSSAVL